MPGHLVVIKCLLTTHTQFLHALLISGSVALHSENVLCAFLNILRLMAAFLCFVAGPFVIAQGMLGKTHIRFTGFGDGHKSRSSVQQITRHLTQL